MQIVLKSGLISEAITIMSESSVPSVMRCLEPGDATYKLTLFNSKVISNRQKE